MAARILAILLFVGFGKQETETGRSCLQSLQHDDEASYN